MRTYKSRWKMKTNRSNFYKSRKWRYYRKKYIDTTNGLCERCGMFKAGRMEVNHIDILNDYDYVNQTPKCYNFDNLELLCKDCHNKYHNRFSKKEPIREGYTFDSEGYPIKKEE